MSKAEYAEYVEEQREKDRFFLTELEASGMLHVQPPGEDLWACREVTVITRPGEPHRRFVKSYLSPNLINDPYALANWVRIMLADLKNERLALIRAGKAPRS